MQAGQIIMTPGGPHRAIYPMQDFCVFNLNAAAGASSQYIKQTTGGAAATGDEYITGCWQWVQGHVYSALAEGGALVIEASMDGIAVWDEYARIRLIGQTITFFGPLEIGGFNIKVKLYNDSVGNVQLFQGLLHFKAV